MSRSVPEELAYLGQAIIVATQKTRFTQTPNHCAHSTRTYAIPTAELLEPPFQYHSAYCRRWRPRVDTVGLDCLKQTDSLKLIEFVQDVVLNHKL